MDNYVLAQAYGRTNAVDGLWYVMDTSDLATLAGEQDIHFGDKAYVIKTKSVYIMGNDSVFYPM